MSLQLMQEIHSGVKTVLSDVHILKGRVDSLEGAGLEGRKIKALSGGVYTDQTDRKEISFLRVALANIFAKDGVSDPFKKAGVPEWAAKTVLEATQKAMDTATSGAGAGYVIPQEFLGTSFIEMIRAHSVVLRAGATLLTGLTGSPALLPKQLTSASVYWIGQNASITASDPSFGQVQMTPKTMAIRAQYSNLLNILSSPRIEEIMRLDFAKVAALELDRVCLRGIGASNEPLGVNGVGSLLTYAIGTNGGPLTIDDLYALQGLMEDSNTIGKTMALISSPKGLRKLKKQRIANYSGQTDGSYAIQPPLLTDESLSKAIGLTCLSTTQIPVNLTKGSSTDCTELFFGDWQNLLIGQWGAVEILATNVGGNAWTQNAIEVRLIQNVDVQVRHGESFVLCNDARTA
jgi:HK97 family phage major capsid protein